MKNIQQIITGKSHEGIEQINIPNTGQEKGGFFDLPKDKQCKHKEHHPPMHIHIPQGKGYRHVCPGCGQVTTLIPPQISFNIEYLKCHHGVDKRFHCQECHDEKDQYFQRLTRPWPEPPKRIPIFRGCNAEGGCFCSGRCKEIIGYRDPAYPGEC